MIVFSVLTGAAICVVMVFSLYLYCFRRLRSDYKYESVRHDLDEEEMEFKKSIEMQADELDDLFSLPNKDLDFDPHDRDTLIMLEKYRSNLVAAAGASNETSDDDHHI